jgi:hypothetical protein
VRTKSDKRVDYSARTMSALPELEKAAESPKSSRNPPLLHSKLTRHDRWSNLGCTV